MSDLSVLGGSQWSSNRDGEVQLRLRWRGIQRLKYSRRDSAGAHGGSYREAEVVENSNSFKEACLIPEQSC